MALVGDELTVLRQRLNLVDVDAGGLFPEADLHGCGEGFERDLLLDFGNCAVRSEENVAGATIDDGLDLVEGLAVFAFFSKALDGCSFGIGLTAFSTGEGARRGDLFASGQ